MGSIERALHDQHKNRSKFSRCLNLLAALFIFLGSIVYTGTKPAAAMSGSGTGGDPYIINSCTDLQDMADDLAASYRLGGNVDCSASSGWDDGMGFVPVGDNSTPFTGSFDGNHKTISGLYIDRVDDDPDTTDSTDPATNQDYIGLFGKTQNAAVKDVSLSNVRVRGYQYVGGIIGYMSGGTLSGSSVNKNVADNACGSSGYCVWARYGIYGGGLVGYLDAGTISQSSTAGPVKGSGNIIGGLVGGIVDGTISKSVSYSNVDGGSLIGGAVGFVESGSTLEGVSAHGNVTANLDDEVDKPGYYAGGLVGNAESASINTSFATGSVHADLGYVGGLIGRSYDVQIHDAFATGEVSGGKDDNYGVYAGGFIGAAYDSHVYNAYSSGNVTAFTSGGSFFGSFSNGSAGDVHDSFTTSHVTAPDSGSLAGFYYDDSTSEVENFYYDQFSTGQTECAPDFGDSGCNAVNEDGSQSEYFYDSSNLPFNDGSAVWDSNTWHFSGSALPVLIEGMTVPAIISPASHSYNRNLDFDYILPDNALPGSVVLTFDDNGTTHVINLGQTAAGRHQLTINSSNPVSSAGVDSTTFMSGIPDGTYDIRLSYRPFTGDPVVISDPVTFVHVLSAPEILCYGPSVTNTTAHVSCFTVPSPPAFGVETWEMQYQKSGETAYHDITLSDIHDATATLTSLTPGTDYEVRFRFTNDGGTSDWAHINITTTGTAPDEDSGNGDGNSSGSSGSGSSSPSGSTTTTTSTSAGTTKTTSATDETAAYSASENVTILPTEDPDYKGADQTSDSEKSANSGGDVSKPVKSNKPFAWIMIALAVALFIYFLAARKRQNDDKS